MNGNMLELDLMVQVYNHTLKICSIIYAISLFLKIMQATTIQYSLGRRSNYSYLTMQLLISLVSQPCSTS